MIDIGSENAVAPKGIQTRCSMQLLLVYFSSHDIVRKRLQTRTICAFLTINQHKAKIELKKPSKRTTGNQ